MQFEKTRRARCGWSPYAACGRRASCPRTPDRAWCLSRALRPSECDVAATRPAAGSRRAPCGDGGPWLRGRGFLLGLPSARLALRGRCGLRGRGRLFSLPSPRLADGRLRHLGFFECLGFRVRHFSSDREKIIQASSRWRGQGSSGRPEDLSDPREPSAAQS